MTLAIETIDTRSLPHDRARAQVLARMADLQPGEALDVLALQEPTLLLQAVLAEFPLGFDFAPLKPGPGQWRYHICRRGPRAQHCVTDYLAWDHDRLDALLESAMDHARRGKWPGARALADDFSHGLVRHIQIEEEILFPAFEEATGMHQVGPTMVMRHEHVDIQQHLRAILEAMRAEDYDAAERGRADLLGVLVAHNMKEESILYPTTDRLHSDESLEELVVKLMLG